MSSLDQAVDQLVNEFDVSPQHLNKCVDFFCEQAKANLAADSERGLPMIPTFVTGIPNGSETGLYLAADLGGSNFRVCSVNLLGNSKFDIVQQKWAVPKAMMRGSMKGFFAYLVDCIQEFLEKHHEDHFTRESYQEKDDLKLGFTFSFPVEQTSINSGKLLRWTKDFDIKKAVGQDVCAALQQELNARKLRVHVAALINDTVGCLMARAYANGDRAQTVMGCIFGTGTNAAYSEKIKNIGKYDASKHADIKSPIMIINTEWGSFDNDLKVLPNTRFDKEIDKDTPNPGFHMFEKRVSGMFLGEILRRVLLELQEQKLLFAKEAQDDNKNLVTPWSADTSVPSYIESDSSANLELVGATILESFGYDTSLEERKAIKTLAHAIGRRAAYLAAATSAGLLKQTKVLEKFDKVDIGGDGAVIEFYPNFEKMVREAWKLTTIGADEKRITIGVAKDGSGVGAALCALVAPSP